MADRSISVTLQANIAGYMAQMRTASKATSEFGDRLLKNQQLAQQVGRGMVVFGGGVLAGLGMATKAAIDWEKAWTGVTKTVDGSPEQMAALEGELRGLARTLPVAHDEIASVAEAAGQLGIKRRSIAEFTETMVALGVTTNLSSEEAATGLARFMNIMGTAKSDVERLGSTVVDLGNNAETTEAEILELGTRLAAAGKIAGLSEADVFAFATTLTSVGVEAEAGGTALSKVFTKVRDAVLTGGEDLQTFAKVSGTTAEKFARDFEADPARAIESFIAGLGRMNASGKSTTEVFESLSLTDQRLMRALLSTAEAGDHLTQQLERGNKAWRDNTALAAEAEKFYGTAAAKITIAWNNIKDAAIDIGGAIAPIVGGAAEQVADLASAFTQLPGPVKTSVAALGSVLGLASLTGGAFLMMLPRIAETKKAMQTMGIATDVLGGKMKGLAKFAAGPWGIAIIGAVSILAQWTEQRGEIARRGNELLGLLGEEVDLVNRATGAYERLSSATQKAYAENLITKHEDLVETLQSADLTLGDLVGSLFGERDAIDEVNAAINDGERVNVRLLEILDLEGAALSSAAEDQEALGTVTEDTGEKTKKAADEIGKIPGAVGEADPAMESLARHFALAAEDAEEAGKAVTEMTDKWAEAFAEFAPPLEAYQNVLERKEQKEQESAQATADSTKRSSDSWEDYAGNVKVTVKEYFAELRKMTRAQRDWAKNMVTLAARVPADVLDYLAQLGPEGAGQVQLLTRMTDKEMRNWIKMMRNSGQVGGQEFAARLKDAQPVLQAIADQLGQGVANRIAAGMAKRGTTVTQEAKRQGIRIDEGVGVDDIRVVKISADAQRAMDRLKFFKDNANRLLNDIDDRTVTIDANLRFGGAGTGSTSVNAALSSTGRAEGGMLPGPPSSKDNMLVPMASGEYVVRASEVRKNLPLLEAINSGRGFASGGLVNLNVNASSSMGTTRSDMIDAIQKHGQDNWLSFLPSGGGSVGAGVERWRGVAMQALALAGSPLSWIGSLLRRMNQESGGNPMAINLWDSNAAAGIPSKGLMQTIDPTFNAYAGALRGRGVWNPLANIFASINYANARYGAAPIGWDQPGGYAAGGQLPGSASNRDNMVVRAASGEYIVNARSTARFLPLLEAINEGKVNGFHKGGMVRAEDGSMVPRSFYSGGKDTRPSVRETPWRRLTDGMKDAIGNASEPLKRELRQLNRVMGRLRRLMHKADAHWFGRRVGAVRERLANMLKRRERIDDRLERAISRRDSRIEHRRSIAGGLRSSIFDQRNMVGGFGVDRDGEFAAGDIANSLEANLQKTRRFQRLLRRMRRRGFRANVIGQIAQAGPEEGFETAEALAGADRSEVRRINRSFVGIHKAATGFSREIGRKLYGAGIQAARGLVRGLRSRRRQINRTMRSIARSLIKAMKDSLEMRSPSKIMRKIGFQTISDAGDGMAKAVPGALRVVDGFAREIPKRAAMDLAQLRPFVPGQMGGGAVHNHYTVIVKAPNYVGSHRELEQSFLQSLRTNPTFTSSVAQKVGKR